LIPQSAENFVKSSSCTTGGGLGTTVQRCVRDLCK
jgi:hypothetical protein